MLPKFRQYLQIMNAFNPQCSEFYLQNVQTEHRFEWVKLCKALVRYFTC